MNLNQFTKVLVDSANLEQAATALYQIACMPNKITGQVKTMVSSWDIGARFHEDKGMIKAFGWHFEQPLNIFAQNVLNTGKESIAVSNEIQLDIKPRKSFVLDTEGNRTVDEEGNPIIVDDGFNFIFKTNLNLDSISIPELESTVI